MVLFFSAAIIVVLIDRAFVDSIVALRILAVFLLFFLIILRQQRVTFKVFVQDKKIQTFVLFSGTFFLMLLVVSTGGFLSPFFILIHIASLALAFLVTFAASFVFLLASITVILLHAYIFSQAHVITIDLPLLAIYLVSIGVIVPFSALIASKYRLKGETVDYLFKQFVVSQAEEMLIVNSIEEGIITLDREFAITRVNGIAQNLTLYDQSSLARKNFFSVFTFKDKNGQLLKQENFPLEKLFKEQTGFREGSLAINRKDGKYVNIDFRLSSILGVSGSVEGFLFIFRDLTGVFTFAEKDLIVQASFYHFFDRLGMLRSAIFSLQKEDLADGLKEIAVHLEESLSGLIHSSHNLFRLYEIASGGVSALLEGVNMGTIVRQAFDEANDLGSEHKISVRFLPQEQSEQQLREQHAAFKELQPISEKHIADPRPYAPTIFINGNIKMLNQALHELTELVIDIASSQKDASVLYDIFLEGQKVFVVLRVTCREFQWALTSELFKPFFGRLQSHQYLRKAEGLEGYLAYTLLEYMQADVSATKWAGIHEEDQLAITIKFPKKEGIAA